MLTSNWIFSLGFRLVLGFSIVLALALGVVSTYVVLSAQREARLYTEELETVQAARVRQLVNIHYDQEVDDTSLQEVIQQVGDLYGWRVVVRHESGEVLADSQPQITRSSELPALPDWGAQPSFPGDKSLVVTAYSTDQSDGSLEYGLGSVELIRSQQQAQFDEPSISSLVEATNRTLLVVGLISGVFGVVGVLLLARRLLSPIHELTNAAVKLGQGDLTQRVAVSGRDEISQLSLTFNSMAQALEESENQRRNLISDVAHELRTPLSNMQGYVEAVRDGLLQPTPSTMGTLHEQTLQLTGLVEDLRILAQADSGNLVLNLDYVNLDELLRELADSFRPRMELKSVEFSLVISKELPRFHGDRLRLTQILSNLIDNATNYTPTGGKVSISAGMAGGWIRIVVSDTGEGITEEGLARIFDRFYREDRSRNRSTGGSGLGLAITKQLVEAHGGTIEANSRLGDGSSFEVKLPLEGS